MQQKAGLSENRADYVNAENGNAVTPAAPDSTGTATSKASSPSDYIPKEGDVVEFEYGGEKLKAIAYMEKSMGLCIMDNANGQTDGGGYNRILRKHPKIVFRKIGEVDTTGITRYQDARKKAKAYFSNTFTPDPDKSYAENQAAWIEFHGLKVGDKVKVMLTCEGCSNGWGMSYVSGMERHIGRTVTIEAFRDVNGILANSAYWPYSSLEPVK